MKGADILNKAMIEIYTKGIQSGTFYDSCSFTGDDYDYCIFCGESNQDDVRKFDNRPPVVHARDCIYLQAKAFV